MAKNVSVFTRVNPVIKEQAKNGLDQLGTSMVMEIFLRQIAFGALTEAQFNGLMEQSFAEYKQGKTMAAPDVAADMNRKYGI